MGQSLIPEACGVGAEPGSGSPGVPDQGKVQVPLPSIESSLAAGATSR